MTDPLQLIGTFLGGGILVALINWSFQIRTQNRKLKLEFLDRQVRELYGPLYDLVLRSERLLALNRKFLSAYDTEYVRPEFSRDEATRKTLDAETSKTLEIANRYIARVEENSLKMQAILDSHYASIDPEDVEFFSLFYEHLVRRQTEWDREGKLETPQRIYAHIGETSFLGPEVIEGIKSKFISKKNRIDELMNVRSWWHLKKPRIDEVHHE